MHSVTSDTLHKFLLALLKFLHCQEFVAVFFEESIALLVLPFLRLKLLLALLLFVAVVTRFPQQLVMHIQYKHYQNIDNRNEKRQHEKWFTVPMESEFYPISDTQAMHESQERSNRLQIDQQLN